jgi:hypothetical protein
VAACRTSVAIRRYGNLIAPIANREIARCEKRLLPPP